ncbi:N-acetylglucosamine-6-phosphate deacetylase [Streptomyces boninensis]|uniref:N-acetylglucosamine-6-phosphate deacetylase n=1 Tax=Streptomyces boninensis TaxID=2039455 RepID=UPI003B20E6D8
MTTIAGRLPDGRTAAVTYENGRITAVTPRDGGGSEGEGEGERLILPGLVDIQVNGYAGIDVNGDATTADDIGALVRALWRRGVTTLYPTIITAPEERIVSSLRAIAAARAADPLVRHAIPGVHVEGPYLCAEDGPRGAHDARYLRDPDAAEFARWQRAGEGLVRIVTLAPERPGAPEYIAGLARQGVLAAIGHTAATGPQITAAADAGARLSTHLGNGAHPVLPRHPNYLWAQLAEDRLAATFIADGHHLPADTFTAMLRAKGPERALLVSDSAALAGCPPGDYTTPVGGHVTVRPDGRLTLAGSDLLAGSGRSLADCAAWALAHTEADLATVVRLAAGNPARLLDLAGRATITRGAHADLVVADRTPDGGLAVRLTVVNGVVVHES